MKNNRLINSFLALFVLLLLTFPHPAFSDYLDGYYEVARIIDGDTFELTDGKSVRLIGINTPEVGETCSAQATQQLSSLIEGKTVFLEKDVSETDIYDRLLRYVYVNGVFVNLELVYNGYAYAVEYPPDIAYASQLADAEEDARNNERGCLWGTSCSSDCYVHITKTGSKYHASDCRYLSQSDIRICRDDAISQGYTACSVCKGYCDGYSINNSWECFIATAAYDSPI